MNGKTHSPRFKEILKTFNAGDIAFVKSLLDENDIHYYINNENANMVGMLTFAEPMRVMVEESQYSAAKEMLAEFEGNFTKFSNPED